MKKTPKVEFLVGVVLPVYHRSLADKLMSEYCIRTMRATTDMPYVVVVVERAPDKPEWALDPKVDGNRMMVLPADAGSYVRDFNKGVAHAQSSGCTHVVHIGNDVFTSYDWLHALADPFARFADCGVSTTAVGEVGYVVGPRHPVPGMIVEGMYGPFMMFHAHRRLDEGYVHGAHSDADLVMQCYADGLRAYRNCGVQVVHLNMWGYRDRQKLHEENIKQGQTYWRKKWRHMRHLWMYGMINAGNVVFGKEHEPSYVHNQLEPEAQPTPKE